jgi:hypothetical protein
LLLLLSGVPFELLAAFQQIAVDSPATNDPEESIATEDRQDIHPGLVHPPQNFGHVIAFFHARLLAKELEDGFPLRPQEIVRREQAQKPTAVHHGDIPFIEELSPNRHERRGEITGLVILFYQKSDSHSTFLPSMPHGNPLRGYSTISRRLLPGFRSIENAASRHGNSIEPRMGIPV